MIEPRSKLLVTSGYLLLVVRPGAPFIAFLLLVAMPGAPSSFLIVSINEPYMIDCFYKFDGFKGVLQCLTILRLIAGTCAVGVYGRNSPNLAYRSSFRSC